jgi:hypothetical protein
MFALALDRKEWGNNLLSFFRTKNGSRLGVLDTSNSVILYNSTAFKRNPTGILDLVQLKVYPANIQTIIHLGAQQLKIFQEDVVNKIVVRKGQIQLLGLPAIAALYPYCISEFKD